MSAIEDTGIGSRLRAARERLGWSREELAFHSGLSWSAIAQVESGRRRNLRPSTLSALAGALGVAIDYLVRGGVSPPAMLEHRALLYDTNEEFLNTAEPFMAEGIERSEAVLAVTTSENVELLRDRLGAGARRVEFAEQAGWYHTPSSALNTYRSFANRRLAEGAPWIRIIGDPAWVGRSESEVRQWTRYESLVNLVFSAVPASILCTYDTRTLAPEIVRQAGVTHPHTIGRHGTTSSSDFADPSGFVLGT
jgi:transcriptional regulator with XRE-family HTH domain